MIDRVDRVSDGAQTELRALRATALAALQARDYPAAEKAFADLLARAPNTRDASFMMGLTKAGLEKWEEAKGYLEIATTQDPKRPEPKTRLGLTYVKLGNIDGAKQQRGELASLDQACKGACEDAKWIADGLVILDQALDPNRATAIIGAPKSGMLAAGTAPASPPSVAPKDFDPSKYSLVTFTDTRDLYDLLTQEGRCQPSKLAERKQPCALILYKSDNDTEDTLAANFKPVFKVVNRTQVWAIHDKKLQKVRIEDLYFDEEQIIGKTKSVYRSVALVGNAENAANCAKGLTCLANLVVQDMFKMYSNMPPSVVEAVWGP
ncbi:MAG: tetratricopeptide repeat protein, partial [Phenylobacterium sp.]